MSLEQNIAIMKFEVRLANRTEGMRNWTPEARAKSLAVRRARGSVWGWDKRQRATGEESMTPGLDRIMEDLHESAPAIRRQLEIERAGGKTIGPRDPQKDLMRAQQLEAFKKWLAEVKRVEGAIDDFNGTVAALGGLTSGAARAQRGQKIGQVVTDPVAEAAAKKAAVEKSIRRNYEKRNADYLRQNPEDRGTMLDMVAEKAEYYSAQPARKVELEKTAYRRIRGEGAAQMRETPKPETKDYKTLLAEKRAFVREREAVRVQLKPGESARQIGDEMWIGRMPDGQERLIRSNKPAGVQTVNDDLLDAMEEARLGARMGSGLLVNRHTSACASSKGEKCNCSCGGAQHGTQSSASGTKEDGKPEEEKKPEPTPDKEAPESSPEFETLQAGFRDVISKGGKPTRRTLIEQFKKDLDGPKLQLAIQALAEAWHTYSLDKFQDKFGRDPKNNFEFRTFQKKAGVPPEFIGGK